MKMKKISLVALTLALMVISCAPLKKYTPDNNVSNDLYGRGVAVTDSTMASLSWKEVFKDEHLQSLIQKALDTNLDMKMAYEHLKQAEASLLGAKMAYIPSLSINPSGGYMASNKIEGLGWNYTISASASWEADIFGRMANQKKIAKITVEQMKDERQAVRVSLISSVANIYYSLLMLDAELNTSREMEKVWSESVEAIHDLKREGFADEVAVSQYEATYSSLRATSAGIEESIKTYENSLSMLLSESCKSYERGKLQNQTLCKELQVGVPVQMLTYRPDVRSAQRSVEIAYYMTKDAWINFFPRLVLSGSQGITNASNGVIMPVASLTNLVAGLTAPILSSGVNKANLRKMQSQQEESKYNFNKVLLNAAKEVNDAIIAIEASKEKKNYYASQVTSLERARDDTKLLMDNSSEKTYLDVLAAHNALIEAQFNRISNIANGFIGMVHLYEALGGGSEY